MPSTMEETKHYRMVGDGSRRGAPPPRGMSGKLSWL